jgi:hypothetical protein
LRRIIKYNKDPKIVKATQNVNNKLLVAVSEYGIIPIKLHVNTNPKIVHTFKNKAPLSSTFLPIFTINKGATTSSIKVLSSCSKIKSSSSSSSEPPNKKNPAKNVIKVSSQAIEKLIIGSILVNSKNEYESKLVEFAAK